MNSEVVHLNSAARAGKDGAVPVGRPEPTLAAEDYRRLFDVLSDCESAHGERLLREAALDALAVNFGYRHVSFFLGAHPSVHLGFEQPVALGVPMSALRTYLDQFASIDPFGSVRGRRLLQDSGLATLGEVAGIAGSGRAAHDERTFMDGFLRRHAVADKMVVWLNTGQRVHGYVVVVSGDRAFDYVDRQRMKALRPHLAYVLSHSLPRVEAAVSAALSKRETQVAGLVVQGLTNRRIAGLLDIGEDTVKKHVTAVLAKSGVRSRTELTARTTPAAGDLESPRHA